MGIPRTGWPDYEYHHSLRGWLKLHKEPTDYQDARVTCHLEGALMASEWNTEFTTALFEILSSFNNESAALYSGVKVTFPEGVYKYDKGEPTLSFGADLKVLDRCIVLTGSGSSEEVDCQEHFPYVCYAASPSSGCEKDENLAKHNLTCAGYKFERETGNCYKFHTQEMNWTSAYKACRKEGAFLAIVNSYTESWVLKGLFPSGNDSIAAIGTYYWEPANSWWTINGQSAEDTGYSEWYTGRSDPDPYNYRHNNRDTPSNSDGNYGYINKDTGNLNGHNETIETPFICQKKPS